ncbi:MAG: hypothetical protein IPM35_08780 [Myxococcales bacterium]|nr:hypothetical protein [Myxococcales bacterium]
MAAAGEVSSTQLPSVWAYTAVLETNSTRAVRSPSASSACQGIDVGPPVGLGIALAWAGAEHQGVEDAREPTERAPIGEVERHAGDAGRQAAGRAADADQLVASRDQPRPRRAPT